jgi:hypothetical protein
VSDEIAVDVVTATDDAHSPYDRLVSNTLVQFVATGR